jgi:hypothetical protein
MTGSLTVEGPLAVGFHPTQPAYNSIGTGTPTSSSISNDNDLYVQESIEVDINMYVDGAIYLGTDSADDDDSIYMDSGTEYLRWDESENDFLFSDDLRVTGEYTYSSPRTYYLNIPAAAFYPNMLSDEIWVVSDVYAYIAGGGTIYPFSIQATAPVQLPQGATVTGFRLYYYDDLTLLSISLAGHLSRTRVIPDIPNTVWMASISATTSSNGNQIQFFEDTTISYATIDNENYQYTAYVSFIVDPSPNSGLRFYGARVAYTVDTVAN